MAIPVKINVFEGPLDLLLHLIEKNKIDIYDIPIVEITDQYMEYLHSMEKEDLGTMSEFMVMAATLLDIKCKMLLPKETNDEGEEEDPREELVQKLLEYKMYKYMSYELKDYMDNAAGVFFRAPDLPGEVRITACFSIGDGGQRLPDRTLKGCTDFKLQRQLELRAQAAEIFRKLLRGLLQQGRFPYLRIRRVFAVQQHVCDSAAVFREAQPADGSVVIEN